MSLVSNQYPGPGEQPQRPTFDESPDAEQTRIRPAGQQHPGLHQPYQQPPAPPHDQHDQQPAPYGEQPQQPAPYGEQPQQPAPYGQQPYGQPGQPGQYGQPGGQPAYLQQFGYASWGQRVVGTLWDVVYLLPALAVYLVGGIVLGIGVGMGGTSGGVVAMIGVLVVIGGLGWMLWRSIKNQLLDQGATGYTYGKRKVGIRLLSEQTNQPLGALMVFVRQIAHMLDSFAFYLGWLWPLWDDKRQTFADKVVSTHVVQQPDHQAPRA